MDLYMKQFDQVLRQKLKKYEVLRDMDLFVLDNSIRESTVGQLRGHTSADKWRILDEVKKCGFTDTIVASFSQDLNVDDDFIEELALNKEDMSGLYAFSEITTGIMKLFWHLQEIKALKLLMDWKPCMLHYYTCE